MFRFEHNIAGFNPAGILMRLGVSPRDPRYYAVYNQVNVIIINEVTSTAIKLHQLINTRIISDMNNIDEYRRFPRYMTIMNYALSNTNHIDCIWGRGNNAQAKFIDTDLLGDAKHLQEIQKVVYPLGGTLKGWIIVYNSWLAGKSNLYEDIVNARLDIMQEECCAPFWELIEYGNGHNAYPTNGAFSTLTRFGVEYQREMAYAFERCLVNAKSLIRGGVITGDVIAGYLTFNNVGYYGSTWQSRSGNTVFMISGSGYLISGQQRGVGFIFDKFGQFKSRWSGKIPM